MRPGAALIAFALAAAACGKSGPPLPPLHPVPDAVSDLVARRTADEVHFRFVIPSKNLSTPGPVNIERIEIFGATVAAGAVAPPNRELMTDRNRIGTIAVRPPAKEGETTAATPAESRPAPGEVATFVESLDEAKLTPTYTTPELPAAAAAAAPAAAAAAAEAVAKLAPVAKRIYTIRGVSRSGRPGQPSRRIELPLTDPPPPPVDLAAKFTETSITLAWMPPPAETTSPFVFNVYLSDGTTPLNATPLSTPAFERSGVEFGKEECFVVRSVTMAGAVAIESAPSASACVTPADAFPPAAPKGLAAVAASGVISLIWDANTEPDLAGYVVLRGEAPGDTLQALTPAPIKETTFRDTTVKAGVRYVYAIVAVDTAKPPNTSAQSDRVEETAR